MVILQLPVDLYATGAIDLPHCSWGDTKVMSKTTNHHKALDICLFQMIFHEIMIFLFDLWITLLEFGVVIIMLVGRSLHIWHNCHWSGHRTNKQMPFDADVFIYLTVNKMCGSVLHDRLAIHTIKLFGKLLWQDELTEPGHGTPFTNMNYH